MMIENLTLEQQRQNADDIVSKQLHYLKKTLLKNINFAEKAFINDSISAADQWHITEMNHELIEILADVAEDYDRNPD
jgi:glycerol-3-phosphate responsive antiterminator